MNNNLNQSHTERHSAESQWAKDALLSVINICCVNISVVEAGLFPCYIHEMKSTEELFHFTNFLIALRDSREAFIKVTER